MCLGLRHCQPESVEPLSKLEHSVGSYHDDAPRSSGLVVTGTGSGRLLPPSSAPDLTNFEHIVVIYMENRSFRQLFGLFPGANGLDNASATSMQVDPTGQPYTTLPPRDGREQKSAYARP